MRRADIVPAILVMVLLATACNGGGGDAATTTTGADTTTTTAAALPGGELVGCANPAGFALARPERWSTDDGCGQFAPEPFEDPGATDDRVAAITAYIDPVPFAEVAAPDPARAAERATTAVDGLQAVRLEYDAGPDALWPEGTPITLYAVDLSPGVDRGPGTLFLDTVGLEPFDYERNRVVLDRMARTVEITRDDVETDPSVVARYEGGGGGFRVTGEVTRAGPCLRIPPGGDPVCADVPPPDGLRTVELVDLDPVLAGVTGEQVFRVTAERPGAAPSTVLPSPIPGSDLRGFAYVFGLDEVERLRLFDVAGAELTTVEPAGGGS